MRSTPVRITSAIAVLTLLHATVHMIAGTAQAQQAAALYERGNALQSWQDPGHRELISQCTTTPPPFSIGGGSDNAGPPPEPVLPVPDSIPEIIAAGSTWQLVWAWEGNNTDGLIAAGSNALLFANNDANNVMQLNLESGVAAIVASYANTGGAVSRSANGELFLLTRGLHSGIELLEPERRIFADSFNGEPLDCLGGVMNDLVAARNGGVYFTISRRGLFYADANGHVSEYGTQLLGANGVILSPDEQTLYVTNGPVVVAFDVAADGALSNEREFAQLRGGRGGDGSAVDQRGRLFVSTGAGVNVFSPTGEFLGDIPGPPGTHGVAFGGPDKSTMFVIVLYGDWGTASARNRIYSIPVLTHGYSERAK